MLKRLKQRLAEERGAVLVWVAGSMIAFLGFAALAVDLGWLYVQTTRLQSAADAAALAGVVHLPMDRSAATSSARDATVANGYAGSVLSETNFLPNNNLEAVLSTTTRTWFLPVLGIDEFNITRSSRAEYVRPVALGSPDNQFGGGSQDFWAGINGRFTDKEQGDPYATQCNRADNDAPTARCTSGNSEFRAEGYYYGIDVPVGTTSFTVSFYDPGHFLRNNWDSASTPEDYSWRQENNQWGVNLVARLYAPDTTAHDPRDNDVLVCERSWTAQRSNSNGSFTSDRNNWVTMCTVTGAVPGIYVLQLPPPNWEGNNNFAIRATGNGPAHPSVYGLLDMSIYINNRNGSPRPWLAEIRPEHTGKTMHLSVFDIGESDTMNMRIRGPMGRSVSCRYQTRGASSWSTSSTCSLNVGNRRYNDTWLDMEIALDGYTCNPAQSSGRGCWWYVEITNMSNPTDRTTWNVSLGGNPVRLNP